MHNKLSHGFFSNNKALLSSTRTSYIIVKKGISIGMLLGYGYMRNNLVRLGGYPTHRDVADMSYFFYFYFAFIYNQVE